MFLKRCLICAVPLNDTTIYILTQKYLWNCHKKLLALATLGGVTQIGLIDVISPKVARAKALAKASTILSLSQALSRMVSQWVLPVWMSLESCGLYCKHTMIINDASRVVSEWCHNLECRSWVINYYPIETIYTPFVMLLVQALLLAFIIYNCNMRPYF